MKRMLARIALALIAMLIVAAIGVYWSLSVVPDEYERALAIDPAHADRLSTEMFNEGSRLVSDAKRPGRWDAVFTAEQINAYLAVDFVKQFPGTLPPEARDPRIVLGDGEATVYCRYDGKVGTVLSLKCEAYLSEPNVVAIRIRGVWAGALPLPLSDVIDGVTVAARAADLRLSWRQIDGDPVALVTIPPPANAHGRAIHIESLDLKPDAIKLRGQTKASGRGARRDLQ